MTTVAIPSRRDVSRGNAKGSTVAVNAATAAGTDRLVAVALLRRR
jgi:hypothetical protein